MPYSTFRGNDATRYGSAKEEYTIEQYKAIKEKKWTTIESRQMWTFCFCCNPWLVASPDGLVSDPSQGLGLLGIKNPYSMSGKI